MIRTLSQLLQMLSKKWEKMRNCTLFLIKGNLPKIHMYRTLKAYLSHSDSRERMQRSDTCCSPTAHQTRASTKKKHAQHVHSTAEGIQIIGIQRKSPKIEKENVQECIMGAALSNGIVQGQPQQPITMVSGRRGRKEMNNDVHKGWISQALR